MPSFSLILFKIAPVSSFPIAVRLTSCRIIFADIVLCIGCRLQSRNYLAVKERITYSPEPK